MSDIFPFALETSLSFYLIVYALTWGLHVVFMTYVLAGSWFLAWATLFPGTAQPDRTQQPLARILREWLPFMLSGAITAGVAPLLFVQIIYRQGFYTANLLLGWRWLMVVPVLVVAFYLLYLMKSKLISDWSFAARCGLAVGIAGSFLFVAFCWTTNHLLQIEQDRWSQVYESGHLFSSVGAVAARLLTWVAAAFPVMAIQGGWQLVYFRKRNGWDLTACNSESTPLAVMSLSALGLATASGTVYSRFLAADVLNDIVGPAGRMWLMLVIGGVILQAVGWFFQLKTRCFCSRRMLLVTVGGLLMLLGLAFLREMVRMASVDLNQVTDNTQAAAQVGGFGLFLLFTVVNTALIVVCIRLVGPAVRDNSPK